MASLKFSHLDAVAVGIWLEGASTTILLRNVRRLRSAIDSEADLERLAEAVDENWRARRSEALRRLSREDMIRVSTMTDDELVDSVMNNHGVLPPRWQRLLEEAAERDRRRLDRGAEHRRLWALMQFGETTDDITEQVVRLWATGGTSRKMATQIIGLDADELRELAGRLGIEITRAATDEAGAEMMRACAARADVDAVRPILDQIPEGDDE